MVQSEGEKIRILEELFEIDDLAEDGVYCVATSEEDLGAIAEHARKRLEES